MKHLIVGLVGGLCVCVTAAVRADPITILSPQREITIVTQVGPNTVPVETSGLDQLSNAASATNPATGESVTALASLNSTVQPMQFQGRGFASTSEVSRSLNATANAEWSYAIDFNVAQPIRYDFSGAFTVTGGNNSNRPLWIAQIVPLPSAQPPIFRFENVVSQSEMTSGILQPGNYHFQDHGIVSSLTGLDAVGSVAVDSTFMLTFSEPAATPEPASLLLLGTGIVGVVVRRWRRSSTGAQ